MRFLPGAELELDELDELDVLGVLEPPLLELLPHAARASAAIRLTPTSPSHLSLPFTRIPFAGGKTPKITFGSKRGH